MMAPEWVSPTPANRFVTSPTPGSARYLVVSRRYDGRTRTLESEIRITSCLRNRSIDARFSTLGFRPKAGAPMTSRESRSGYSPISFCTTAIAGSPASATPKSNSYTG